MSLGQEAAELLETLTSLGVTVEPRGERLAVRFPEGRRPDVERLRSKLEAMKPILLAALAGEPGRAARQAAEAQSAVVLIPETLLARIRGQDEVRLAPTAEVEPCWHCVRPGKERGRCACALCGRRRPGLRWEAGACGPCHGTGRLAWPATVQ